MQLKKEVRIAAPREAVWQALNDIEVLRRCLPGCELLERLGEHELQAAFVLRLGPLRSRLRGIISLSEVRAPESYRLSGRFHGGVAGSAEGSSDVRLVAQGTATLLEYTLSSALSGTLGQLGSRLIVGSAERYAARFFASLAQIVAGGA